MPKTKLNRDRALMHLCWHELGPVIDALDKLRCVRDNRRFGSIAGRIEAIRSRLFVPGPHNNHTLPANLPASEMIKRMDATLMKRLNRHLKPKKKKGK